MNQTVPKKPARASASAKRPAKPKSTGKAAAAAGKKAPPAKEVRHCGACTGQVALKARYCRHCGLALAPDVPSNPFLPPPPKPWRPSRIPKQRPHLAAPSSPEPMGTSPAESPAMPIARPTMAVETSPTPVTPPTPSAESISTPTPAAPPKPIHNPIPKPTPAAASSGVKPKPAAAKPAPKPQVWDPLPEVERRMAELAQLHDRIKPQLTRAEMRRRRVPLP